MEQLNKESDEYTKLAEQIRITEDQLKAAKEELMVRRGRISILQEQSVDQHPDENQSKEQPVVGGPVTD